MLQNGAKAVKKGSSTRSIPWCDCVCRMLANYGVAQSRTSNCGMQRNKQHPLCVYTVVQLHFKHVYSGHLTFLTVRPPFYSSWVGWLVCLKDQYARSSHFCGRILWKSVFYLAHVPAVSLHRHIFLSALIQLQDLGLLFGIGKQAGILKQKFSEYLALKGLNCILNFNRDDGSTMYCLYKIS